jgi:hypothetical protein
VEGVGGADEAVVGDAEPLPERLEAHDRFVAVRLRLHAARGGEHAVASEFAVRKWLETEWATLGPPQPDEPLWVPLTADGRIGRLNLRPYRAQGGSIEALHAAFIRGANSFDADPARFRKAWRALGRELEKQSVGHLTADMAPVQPRDARPRLPRLPPQPRVRTRPFPGLPRLARRPSPTPDRRPRPRRKSTVFPLKIVAIPRRASTVRP